VQYPDGPPGIQSANSKTYIEVWHSLFKDFF